MRILLVEPNYYSQYPPLGLLKLSTLYKKQGHEVRFVKGLSLITDFYPDQIDVTSLFTWAWKSVWQHVDFYKSLFPKARVLLGGVYASLMPSHARKSAADDVYVGMVPEAEDLIPDYTLVPQWHNEKRTSILFSYRGCVRSCSFCAVPKLEGKTFQSRTNHSIRHLVHPEHNRLILWDNNFLGQPRWIEIVKEIKTLGLDVDFNQGLDARLINSSIIKVFRDIKMPVVRISYDSNNMGKYVKRAIELFSDIGVSRRDIICYVLFNYKDSPEDFFYRVRNILAWGASVYPMRYQPVKGEFALEKNSFINPSWTPETLSMVAKARRVIGYGGAFPPYEGLKKKFTNAECFIDAFTLRRNRKRFELDDLISDDSKNSYYDESRYVTT